MTSSETAFNDEELSISDATLIARLRDPYMDGYEYRAADRIEQLVATNEALVRKLAWTEAKLEAEELTSGLKLNEANARAERLEAALVAMRKRAMSTRGEQAYRELPVFIIRASSATLKGDDHD